MKYTQVWEIIKRAAKNHEHSKNMTVTSAPTLYKFGEEFAKELIKADVKDIPVSQLPEDWCGCCKVLGAYYFIFFNKTATHMTTDGRVGAAGLCMFTALPSEDRYDFFVTPLGCDFGTTVGEALDAMKKRLTNACHNRYDELFSVGVSALVYVSTGTPDLREYKPPTKETHALRRERDRVVQECGAEPCVLVSWGWKKPRTFAMGSWEVQGHFWWAPVGVGRQKRELRWREGHVRNTPLKS
jgi:hypothetical protein